MYYENKTGNNNKHEPGTLSLGLQMPLSFGETPQGGHVLLIPHIMTKTALLNNIFFQYSVV